MGQGPQGGKRRVEGRDRSFQEREGHMGACSWWEGNGEGSAEHDDEQALMCLDSGWGPVHSHLSLI